MLPKNDSLIGKTLGRYKINRLIAKGGMGRVYEGTDIKIDRKVAVKVITLDEDRAQELMERFEREARAVARLDNHPNIVTIYGYDEDETTGVHYIAMQFIEGQSLGDYFEKVSKDGQRIEVDELLSIMRQIGEALDHAHSQGVIHRDIKPANIMLEGANRDKAILMDFGLVMQLDTTSTLGSAFGTPRYIAPEQAVSSHQASAQSDIYSLGVVVYELLTGKPPFGEDETPMSVALSHITKEPPSPKLHRPDLPEEVVQVIMRALEKKPEDRFQTAAAFVTALEQAFRGVAPEQPVKRSAENPTTPGPPAVPSPRVTTSPPTRQKQGNSSGRAITILVLILILGGGIFGLALLATGGNGDDDDNGSDQVADAEETTTPEDDSGADDGGAVDEDTPTPTETPEEDTPTDTPTATNTPEEDTNTPAPDDTDTPTPTNTPTATDTDVPPTNTPTSTNTPTPTETDVPPTNTEAPSGGAAPENTGQIQLFYTDTYMLILNTSFDPLDLRGVEFREGDDRFNLDDEFSFAVSNWEQRECVFVRTQRDTAAERPECLSQNELPEQVITNPTNFVWEGNDSFSVYQDDRLLGECNVSAERCTVPGILQADG